jgi:hypothetical protein
LRPHSPEFWGIVTVPTKVHTTDPEIYWSAVCLRSQRRGARAGRLKGDFSPIGAACAGKSEEKCGVIKQRSVCKQDEKIC